MAAGTDEASLENLGSKSENRALRAIRVVGQFDDPARAEARRALPARRMFIAALTSAWAS